MEPESELDNAIRVIAYRAISDHLRQTVAIAEAHEDFPDIGEHDWERVVELVDQLAAVNDCDDDDFTDAYRFLTGRADHDA